MIAIQNEDGVGAAVEQGAVFYLGFLQSGLNPFDAAGLLRLFADILADKGHIAELFGTMDVSPQVISLLLYLAVKPSLEAGARQLAARLTGSRENQDN